ncbi:class I SAM-dependent methyltransferase [Haloarchaeobius sp. DFWS5]|uniref:class I SAM-dependent methyltransferase n=1 Tax=Haloarchaeobius sp. DFWS5 TaxID=3446114 RepID=UPI003EBB119C
MDEIDRVRRGYEELGADYAARTSDEARELAILSDFLDSLEAPTRLLDAGCGQGKPVLGRVTEEATAVGLDVSHEQLEVAAETVPPARLVHGEMTRLPFQDDTFDAVTAYNSIIHVPLADHQTVLDEFARVLRTGGRVLLSEASDEFERVNPNWLDSGITMTWHMAGAEATREQLQAAGFHITDEWEPPATTASDGPQPPFFAARLDT